MKEFKNLRKVFFAKGFIAAAILFSICVSGVKAVSAGTLNTQIDLSGTWYAVVNDETGRWNYTLSLSRESGNEWTGTMTVTLNGESPSTTDVSLVSLGGGKMRFVWRSGEANAEDFEGTYTKDKISVSGFGGQLIFTKR